MEGIMYIGICGKQGSGKSTLSKKLLEELNDYIYIDIDKIGHQVNEFDEVKKELISTFGEDIVTDNKINRKLLGKKVFNNQDNMNKLIEITWKYMEREIDRLIGDSKNVIFDWQLLPKVKYFKMCDLKILIDTPYEIREERILKRDNISPEYLKSREESSIIYNNNDFDIVLPDNEIDIERVKMYEKSIISR